MTDNEEKDQKLLLFKARKMYQEMKERANGNPALIFQLLNEHFRADNEQVIKIDFEPI
jgi:hypothetical protein